MGLFDKLQKKVQDTLQNAAPEELMKSVQQKLQSVMPGGIMEAMQNKATEQMENTMSMADVDNLEKQGADVAELRQKVAARIAREQAEAEARVYKLDNLEPYKATPRDPESEFYKDLAAKAPLIGREKWLAKCLTAPIVYTAVVQAHHGLWKPGDYGSMAAVFAFTPNPARMYDTAWLKEVAAKVSDMKGGLAVPPDCREFIKLLRNEQSEFCCKLGASLTDGEETWCATYAFRDQAVLPHKCLPYDRIVPFLLLDPPVENRYASFALIPAKYLL